MSRTRVSLNMQVAPSCSLQWLCFAVVDLFCGGYENKFAKRRDQDGRLILFWLMGFSKIACHKNKQKSAEEQETL